MSRYEIPKPAHAPGEILHGFRVDAVTPLEDIRALATECTHLATGAKLLHLHCDDEENLYAIAFRTPPADSTGVAHILEHSVLAGSRKYPVKDSFKELGKASLNTFLNAMTSSDYTVYPVCSPVRADYFNLAAVYTDLVLNPLITESTFRQEGHHLELKDSGDLDSDLDVVGVVYNEMKGAFSVPDRVVYTTLRQNLFPDNCYHVESGGDPEVIPTLTYERFRDFHRRYYSPSNARWYLYGDIPLRDHLAFLEPLLKDFRAVRVSSEIALQPRWTAPRRVDAAYPVAADEPVAAKTFINVSWLLDAATKPEQTILFDVLEEALVGNAASPLRKALIDSGLGQDLSPISGHLSDYAQTAFAVGLRGSETDRAGRVEQLVLETLKRIAHDGIQPGLLAGAFHQIEFRGKEIVPPFPIMLLFRAATPANYGADPKSGLEFGKLMKRVRARHAADPGLFQKLVQEWLIDNPHRLVSVVAPSTTLAQEKEAALKARMAGRKAALSRPQIEAIRDEALKLKAQQGKPESPEALATLPRLKLSDIPRRLRTIPTEIRESEEATILEHPVFSNGVAYVRLAFDVSDLDEESAPWVPFLGSATVGLGAAGLDYAAMAGRIARSTGGIGSETASGVGLRDRRTFQRLIFHGKALEGGLGELANVFRDLLTASDTSDPKRVRDLAHETHNNLFSQIVPRGHMFAMLRAAASLGLARRRQDQWQGAAQIRFLAETAKRADAEAAAIASRLAALQRKVFARRRLLVDVAGDPALIAVLRGPLDGLVAALPEGEMGPAATAAPAVPKDGGVAITARVNYVSQAMAIADVLRPEAPLLEVASSLLNSEYLYTKIRVQGGAYGGMSAYRLNDGILAFMSYRDPRLVETFDVFRGAADYLRSDAITDDLLERVKIGAIGGFDRILSPTEQGAYAMRAHLLGLRDEDRKAFRDGLFNVTAGAVRDRGAALVEAALAGAPRAALASRAALEAAASKIRFDVTTLE